MPDPGWPMVLYARSLAARGLAAGRLDVVVCNAGYGLAGAVEDSSVAEVKRQFETNFFGAWRVCRAVLPILRRQASGTIVFMLKAASVRLAAIQPRISMVDSMPMS